MSDVAKIASGLTKARRRAIVEGQRGYCDDDSLYGSERRMLYALEELDLFYRPIGKYSERKPDLMLTPLGQQVRAHLLENHDAAR